MTKKRYFFPALFLFLNFLNSCKSSSREGVDTKSFETERKTSFNEDWQFRLGDSLANFSEANWRTLNVPHDWSIEGKFSPQHPAGVGGGALPGGLGWYKKTFRLAPEDSTKITSIRFDGVYSNSEVWINGNYLGKDRTDIQVFNMIFRPT